MRQAERGRLLCRVLFGLAFLVPSASAEEPPHRTVGLALGGGSARAIVHVGVLKWMEDHRVPVDAIAGTSMGALIGGAYATGLSASEIEDLLRLADWDLMFRPDPPHALKGFRRKEDARQYEVQLELGLKGGLRLPGGLNPGHHVSLFLSRISLPYSDLARLDDLPIPFRCVATDLEKNETVVLSEGPLGQALRATMSFPGLFDPIRIDGRLLADGGILNNVPVDVVRQMGTEVVVAVDTGILRTTPITETLSAIADRSLGAMMGALTRRQLEQADLVLSPVVREVGSSDYRRSKEIVKLGYDAAEARSADLLPLALDPEAWEAHLAHRQARRRATVPVPVFVRVRGLDEKAAVRVEKSLGTFPGKPIDPRALETALDRAVGVGRFASASYGLAQRDGQAGLFVRLREKTYGPPFLRLSVDVNNEQQDLDFNVGARTTFMDVLGYGSEWRVDLAVGSTLGAATELFRPLGSSPFFAAARAFSSSTTRNLYENDLLAAVVRRERTGVAIDAGVLVGSKVQFRGGYETAYGRNVLRVGTPVHPESDGRESLLRARFAFDGLDRPVLARRGIRLESTLTWFRRAPLADQPFGQWSGTLSVAHPAVGQDRFLAGAEAGVSFGAGDPPFPYQFTAGGPFRLGAFAIDEFHGRNLILGRVAYLKSIARIPNLVGDRLFAAAIVEAGSAFDQGSSARVKTSVSVGFVADTALGPLFLGTSVGNKGTNRFYLALGRLVR